MSPPQPDDVDVADSSDDSAGTAPSAEESLRHFTADFDVAGIVRRMNNGNFKVPSFNPPPSSHAGYAGFQRNFIWTKKQKDRFIESLLLSYPVPGIFLVEQPDRKYLVLDGQQRLRTLQDFVNGTDSISERSFRLQYVAEDGPFAGQMFEELAEPDQNLLLNTFIQVTVVVPKHAGHLQGVYQLFERINSGGTNLQPQEIRVALYAGSRVDGLRAMNDDPNWRTIFGPPHSRLKDTELILRYLALREVAVRFREESWDREAPRLWLDSVNEPTPSQIREVYRAPLNQFLNSYLESLGPAGRLDSSAMDAFTRTCGLLAPLGRTALRLDDSAQINAAHADAVLVGLSLSPAVESSTAPAGAYSSAIPARLDVLEKDSEYLGAIRESTSHLASVHTRTKIATRAFQDL